MIIEHLLRNKSLEATMRSERIHHQLLPMEIAYEEGFNSTVLAELVALGHRVAVTAPSTGFGAVSAISNKNGVLAAVSDYRRNGSVALF